MVDVYKFVLSRIGDHNSELHIFSSTDLLKGHWTSSYEPRDF